MNKPLKLFGGELQIITDENETDGNFDLMLGKYEPDTEIPLHLHTKYSETVYLTEGTMTIYLKNGAITLNPGEHMVIPQNTAHAIVTNKKIVTRTIVVTSPSGFARLVKEVGVPAHGDSLNAESKPDIELFKKVSAELGDILLGPPGTRP